MTIYKVMRRFSAVDDEIFYYVMPYWCTIWGWLKALIPFVNKDAFVIEKFAEHRAKKLNETRADIIKYVFNHIMVFRHFTKRDNAITDAGIYLDTYDNELKVIQSKLTSIYIDDEKKLCYKLANNGHGYLWSIDTDILRKIYKFYFY